MAVTLSSAPAARPLRGEGRPVAAAAGGSIGERSLRIGLNAANRQRSPGHTEAFKLPGASVRAEHMSVRAEHMIRETLWRVRPKEEEPLRRVKP